MAKRQREKKALYEQNKDRRPRAVVKHVRMSSGKVALVLDLIRGRGYNEAVAILENTDKAASEVILKAVRSAGANAENNLGLSKDDLFVAETYSAQGPTLKRLMIRARGRADRILKRTSHITVILDTVKPQS